MLAACLFAAAGGAGCGMFGHEADQRVSESLANPGLTMSRGQAPDGPKAPITLPPPDRPTLSTLPRPETPSVPPSSPVHSEAPVLQLGVMAPSPREVVTPVAAVEGKPSADKANSAVRPIATVGADNFISDEEVSMMMKQRAMDYILLKGDERVAKEKEVYKEELKKLIDRELIVSEFVGKLRKNNPSALDELWEQAGKMADSQIRARRVALKLKSEAEFNAKLLEQGMDPKLFRRQFERQAVAGMYLNMVLKDKTGTPTLAQVQDYYTRNAKEFQSEDRVKFQQLFISTSRFDSVAAAQKRAEELFAAARSGVDFTQLVKEHGHGDSVLRGGAGVGEKRGEIQPPELEKVIWDIKPGNFSGVVPSENGFYILRVQERQVSGRRPLDEKLQTEIRNKLADKAYQAEMDKVTAQLWRQIGVTIVENR
jgi:parvulin-like peptidyl-prolyl isomerase